MGVRDAQSTANTSAQYFHISSIVVRTIAVLFVWFLFFAKTTGRLGVNFSTFIIVAVFVFAVSFAFGHMMFYGDIENPKEAEVNYGDVQTSHMLLISERTNFYMFVKPGDCSFTFVEKSSIHSIRIKKLPKDDPSRVAIDDCLSTIGYF